MCHVFRNPWDLHRLRVVSSCSCRDEPLVCDDMQTTSGRRAKQRTDVWWCAKTTRRDIQRHLFFCFPQKATAHKELVDINLFQQQHLFLCHQSYHLLE